jgi:hypothetical protein
MTVALTIVLVVTVGGSVAGGTMAGFFDTELSKDNEFGAGTRNLEIGGGPITIKCGIPSRWYSEYFTITSVGSLEALVTVNIPDLDYDSFKGVKCTEDGTVSSGSPPREHIYNGVSSSYAVGSSIGAGKASSESEFIAEEGGYIGDKFVVGMGVDAGSDSGPPEWVISRYLDIRMYFDENGDGDFSDAGELIAEGTLFDIACNTYQLGVIPAPSEVTGQPGGGWGTYFMYTRDSSSVSVPMMMGQNTRVGTLTVWSVSPYLYIEYDTTDSGWQMAETHIYVDTMPPSEVSPSQATDKHNPITPLGTYDLYQIPFVSSDPVYIFAHAEGVDGETSWTNGVSRDFKVELHLQQVEDPAWVSSGIDYDGDGDIDADDAQLRWWPTDVFQGDRCTFDLNFAAIQP